jgi:hypothetical protein
LARVLIDAGEEIDDEETAHRGIREADLAEWVGFP